MMSFMVLLRSERRGAVWARAARPEGGNRAHNRADQRWGTIPPGRVGRTDRPNREHGAIADARTRCSRQKSRRVIAQADGGPRANAVRTNWVRGATSLSMHR